MLAVYIEDWQRIQCKEHNPHYENTYFQHCSTCGTSWLINPDKPYDWGMIKKQYRYNSTKVFQ